MKNRLFLSFVALLFLLPAVTSADNSLTVRTGDSSDLYKTSAQYAWQINATTTLYAIDYWFGHSNYDLYLPTRGVRDQVWNTNNGRLGFSVMEDGKTLSDAGSALAVVGSNAEITDDEMYKVPKGTKQQFRLFVILTTENDAAEADYAILVTDLPFYRYEEREYMKLNPSELQYYLTPEVEFNSDNPSK